MPSNPKTNTLYLYIAALVVIAGFAYWASDLTSDPPMYFSGVGQSLSTDPHQYVYHARNQALFGDMTLFDYARWTVYQHSLTSAVALAVFTIAGVSLSSANFVGLILSMGGLVLLLVGLYRYHRPLILLLVALGFVLNVTLLTYGRLSYLENGLLFIVCTLFAVFCWWGTRTWGAVLCGALVAAAMLTGKLFGFMLLPAILLQYYLSQGESRWRYIGLTMAGFAAAFVVLLLSLYGTDVPAAIGYIGEQSYGLRGFPEGLSSPWGFFEKLVSYGFRNRIFYLNPELLLSVAVAGLTLISIIGRDGKWKDLSPSTGLLFTWIAFGILGLAPLNYSPLRYSLLFTPAIIALAFTIIEDRHRLKSSGPLVRNRIAWAILGYLGWVVAFNIGGLVFFNNVPDLPIRLLTWSSVAPGIALAWLMYWLLRTGRLRFSRRVLFIAGGLILALTVVQNSIRIYRSHIIEHNFNIAETNTDLSEILGRDAVISGPYAPSLTVNTELKSFIHLFGVAQVDSTLFDRYPITHLACDESNWVLASADYPEIRDVKSIATYWIRNYEVKIYDISKSFANSTANAYLPTDYERAASFMHQQRLDSAFHYANRFYSAHPNSKPGAYLIADLLFRGKQPQNSHRVLQKLADSYPTDFYAQLSFGRLLLILAHQSRDESMLGQAYRYFARAVKVNPYAAEFSNRLWEQTRQQAEAAVQNTPPAGQDAP